MPNSSKTQQEVRCEDAPECTQCMHSSWHTKCDDCLLNCPIDGLQKECVPKETVEASVDCEAKEVWAPQFEKCATGVWENFDCEKHTGMDGSRYLALIDLKSKGLMLSVIRHDGNCKGLWRTQNRRMIVTYKSILRVAKIREKNLAD